MISGCNYYECNVVVWISGGMYGVWVCGYDKLDVYYVCNLNHIRGHGASAGLKM